MLLKRCAVLAFYLDAESDRLVALKYHVPVQGLTAIMDELVEWVSHNDGRNYNSFYTIRGPLLGDCSLPRYRVIGFLGALGEHVHLAHQVGANEHNVLNTNYAHRIDYCIPQCYNPVRWQA